MQAISALRQIRLTVASLLICAPLAANAIEVTISYESFDFTELPMGVPAVVENLTGTWTLDVVPFPNPGPFGGPPPDHTVLDFSVTDGYTTFTPSNTDPATVRSAVVTNTLGDITTFVFAANTPGPHSEGDAARFFIRENTPGNAVGGSTSAAGVAYCAADLCSGIGTDAAVGYVNARFPTATMGDVINTDPAGIFTATVVPEIDAAGIPLAFTLLGGLIAIGRERRRPR